MKQIRVHPDALHEADATIEWYGKRSPQAAARFVAEFRSVIERIRQTPNHFPRSAFGTRRTALHHFPYLVVFRETETTIEIVAVAHGRRRPNYWRERLT
jgi:toxin ParE1/3/4